MTILYINTGSSANAGDGDSLRAAFNKVNANFDEIVTLIGTSSTDFTEIAQDSVQPLFIHNSHNGLTASYNDFANRIILTVTGFENDHLPDRLTSGTYVVNLTNNGYLNLPVISTSTSSIIYSTATIVLKSGDSQYRFKTDGSAELSNWTIKENTIEGTGTNNLITVNDIITIKSPVLVSNLVREITTSTFTNSNWSSAEHLDQFTGLITISGAYGDFKEFIEKKLLYSQVRTVAINTASSLEVTGINSDDHGNINIYVDGAPTISPTTVTSLVFTVNLDNKINLGGLLPRLDLISNSGYPFTLRSSSGDIIVESGDDIFFATGTASKSQQEGGDFIVFVGNGGNADIEGVGGSGGDFRVVAGFGGDSNSSFNAGEGGYIEIIAGAGGRAYSTGSRTAAAGGDIFLTAGSAGSNDGNTSIGSQGGNVFVRGGDSTNSTSTGGSIYLYPGNNLNGVGSGKVVIKTVDISTATEYSWEFNNLGTMTAPGHIIPAVDLAYDLGSTSSQWRSLYVGTSTIYIGGVPITVNTTTNTLVVGANVGQAPSTATNLATESFVIDYVAANGGGGGGGGDLSTIIIPETTGTTYKGLQVSYGMVHSNSSGSELNVNKIVIHKPAITTTTIDPTSGQDDFRVSGLGSSDVLAMFVLFGNVNGPKALSTLTNFAETIIDTVILDGGVEGQFNTLADMKSAFYNNYSTISASAGGLDADFEFFNNSTAVNTGTTTVREGTGAAFSIDYVGDTTYAPHSVISPGTNYLVGHKILITGDILAGTTPENDCIITVTGVLAGGAIDTYTVSGVSASIEPGLSPIVTGTNYQVGSGFEVNGIYFTNLGNFDYFNILAQGSNYVAGDVLTLLGSGIENGISPDNDITITVDSVDGSGMATAWTPTGVFPRVWPTNNIGDGGNDQYDNANYINTPLASQIGYNQGMTVADGAAAFGTGSSYTFVYTTGTFGLLVTGNSADYVETSGNSGADGSSTTEAGNLYGPNTAEMTYTNAITHISIVSQAFAGPIVSFTRPDYSNETIDILIPDDGSGSGVAIARDSYGNGIFNPYREGGWDSGTSPDGTLWNTDGWSDFGNVTTRTYTNLYAAFGNGQLGNKIVGTECVMYLPDNGKYYAVKFDSWTQGGNGGGFAYTRRELDINNLKEGIRFQDGTVLKSAEGVGRVKQTASGNRRIEEVYGTSQVSVTSVNTTNLTTTTSRAGVATNEIWIDSTATTIDNVMENPANYSNAYAFEFSMDNTNWYTWTDSTSFDGTERGYSLSQSFTYNQGDTVYFRYKTGGTPVVWWNKADLPGGASNFRGAVIDYHAYSGEATWIGTIHIVDDSGEEHISHTEVGSGTTDSENDDLWVVQNEGTISYRRIDGESKTLKVQWSARVFYGSEFYD